MKSNLKFDFIVNHDDNQLLINKEFNANQQLIWDCYTKAEHLEQWFAPKPWVAKTKSMDFREGGYWLYAMCGPNGEEHWGKMKYTTVNPIDSYEGVDVFCDAEGNVNTDLPRQIWQVTFSENEGKILVSTVITYKTLKDLETILQMGMKEGLTMTLDYLDEYVESLKG